MHGARQGRAPFLWWSAALAVALFAAAVWLRVARIEYVTIAWIATFASLPLAWRTQGRERRWRLASSVLAVLTCLLLSQAQWQLDAARNHWSDFEARLVRRAAARLDAQLTDVAGQLTTTANRALDAPSQQGAAFDHVRGLVGGAGERGVVLYENDVPLAWSGVVRVTTDTLHAPLGATITPFFTTLHAVAQRGTRRAVATVLLHAEPPASTFARPLDALAARLVGVRGFSLAREGVADVSVAHLDLGDGGPCLVGRVRLASQDGTIVQLLENGRRRGSIALILALAAFVSAIWRARRRLRTRLAALGVALACLGVVPLNELSNVSRMFDPALYFASLGGPYTASVGALLLTGAIALLGLLAVLRSTTRLKSRWVALAIVLAIAGLGPFLLRDLARGVEPPSTGVPTALWLAWETALFLVGVSFVLAGATAGRAALGRMRGAPAWVAPLLAAAASVAGPLLWAAPGRWPGWYPVLWVVAIVALALTRRSSRFVAAASIVAALGASTLVWGVVARKRVELARRDIEGLTRADDYALALLNRFAHGLVNSPPPRTRADLLARYVVSDLAAADYPVELASWNAAGQRETSVATARVDVRGGSVEATVNEARTRQSPILREALGEAGVALVLAIPFPDGTVTSVSVLPRTRLVADDPYAPLLGERAADASEPPYAISLTGADSLSLSDLGKPLWKREGNELHGDWLLRTSRGLSRAHAEVLLRPVSALVQRSLLVVLFDLGIVALLWALSVLADGGYARWISVRRRRWARSYRSRLTVVLFAFFVLPAAAFAIWSYRQLQSDDRQSRELLLRETLRGVASVGDLSDLAGESSRIDAPLFLYERGELRAVSDTLYDALAPFGRFLSPEVFLRLGLSDEVTASQSLRVGTTQALLGYRAVTDVRGQRVMLATPARVGEESLDQRRRDLGILVLFTTALGGLAALGLSGLAAKQFARPIGELRDAALAIASGAREPALGARPPVEFLPVYSAFRRMAADLGASREALLDARRRTEAVLRTVASGVIAIDEEGGVTLANPRAETLLGRSLAAGERLDGHGATEIAERVRRFLSATQDDADFEAQVGRRQLRGRLTRLSRSNGAVLTLDDVTELGHAQRILAWGQMARQIAHEIKNPLTPIRLGVQHLRRAFAAGRADFPDILDQNAGRILAEIDRLDEIARSFSRYGTPPTEQPPAEPVDVAPVLQRIVELERMGEDRAIDWTLLGADRPAIALAREGELRDVLLNLAENARLSGARTITISVERTDDEIRISVTDDGEGIPADVLPRIFEPHFSTRTSGSGLGLAISRRLVDGWGGTIIVDSERGRGTVVRVVLRAARS